MINKMTFTKNKFKDNIYWKSYGILLLYNTIQYPIPLPSPRTNLKIKMHTKAASNAMNTTFFYLYSFWFPLGASMNHLLLFCWFCTMMYNFLEPLRSEGCKCCLLVVLHYLTPFISRSLKLDLLSSVFQGLYPTEGDCEMVGRQPAGQIIHFKRGRWNTSSPAPPALRRNTVWWDWLIYSKGTRR